MSCFHTLWLGRFGITYKHGWRFWRFVPWKASYWSGQIIHLGWLCFYVSIDRRTDVLGDLMRGIGAKKEERET